jgi:hypothetical protein
MRITFAKSLFLLAIRPVLAYADGISDACYDSVGKAFEITILCTMANKACSGNYSKLFEHSMFRQEHETFLANSACWFVCVFRESLPKPIPKKRIDFGKDSRNT